jgi:hypothetical protein
MDVGSSEFDAEFAAFEQSVIDHAEHEEQEEFPAVRAACDEDRLKRMGTKLKAAEKMAPTHPHPSAAGSRAAQWMTGPFASMIDRVKDALTTRSSRGS